MRRALKTKGLKLISKAADVETLMKAVAVSSDKSEVLAGGVSDRQEIRGSSVEVPAELAALINESLTDEERARIGKPELVG